jgi:protease-4
MDYDQNDTPNENEIPEQNEASANIPPRQTQPPQPISSVVEHVYHRPPKKKRSIGRIFFGILFTLSILANMFLFMMLIVMALIIPGNKDGLFKEQTVTKGRSSNKIAIIRVEGIIENQLSERVRSQFKSATEDTKVKAVILRIVSPGGTVSASDQIHHEITKFRKKTGKPVVAFMQTVAASGGYYSAVACNEIIAEPTVITGSIGVIMNNFVIKDLLEKKLGIKAVTIKSGPKKDWPSMFEDTTEEQIEYLQQKLIGPAYDRFVKLIDEGRGDKLNKEQVLALADGSIYGADEACENKLIDQVGYLEDAVKAAEKLAGISSSKVFEYREHFSISSILASENRSALPLDRESLSKLAMPQFLYMWDASWE